MAPDASEMNKNHPFWARTHFGYFKPWFGVIILLFYHITDGANCNLGLVEDRKTFLVLSLLQTYLTIILSVIGSINLRKGGQLDIKAKILLG